jgi:hypothetical protein
MFACIGMMMALNRHVERVFVHRARARIGESGSWRVTDNPITSTSDMLQLALPESGVAKWLMVLLLPPLLARSRRRRI